MDRNMKSEVLLRTMKIMDIGFIALVYFMIGVFLAKKFDNYLGPFNKAKEDKKGKVRQILECVGLTWLFGVIIYIVKNMVELIPSPFDGIGGFDHMRVKELRNAPVFLFAFLTFQTHYMDKIRYLFSVL